ncbi:MAG TPA: phosphoenolpyruvate--protein phosphotransferase [Gemmatimonadales bacterium]|jgi:phosphotransferase system enzyme I (PtsI)|nr:phosphoenolpyruvate--protein phosphotransferase [Gemmatimonadales bacterium]
MSDHTLRGIGVSPGIAIGPAVSVQTTLPEVPHRVVPRTQVEKEVRRLRAAVRDVRGHLTELRKRAEVEAGADEARIFDAQILMLEDKSFLGAVEELIRKNHLTAEKAYEYQVLEVRDAWAATSSPRLKERLADLNGVTIQVVRHLLHKGDLVAGGIREPSILVAHELGPGVTVQFGRDRVLGLVSEEGTRTSHAAILAHSMGMPAVMGLAGALERIKSGTMLIVDGTRGVVILDPSKEEIATARAMDTRRKQVARQAEEGASLPAVTTDGIHINVRGNVDLPEEIKAAKEHGAEGVGLLRTEFLITGHTQMPTEDEQAKYFRKVGDAFPGHPIVIRTYDLGGDKFPAPFRAPPEANPFLGWRAIRVCLDQPEMFRVQIRAALRAAAHVPIHLMIPLVTRLSEVETTREMVAEEGQLLKRAGVAAAETVPVGVMVETPAAAVMADRLAEIADFLSVGTNDLTQYTLAVDRSNARLANRFTPHDPSVLRLLKLVAEAARAAGKPASVCGEMASEPISAFLLIGLGYETLSVAPPALPLIRWLVRQVSREQAMSAAVAALAARSADLALDILRYALAEAVDMKLLDPDARLPGGRTSASLPS